MSSAFKSTRFLGAVAALLLHSIAFAGARDIYPLPEAAQADLAAALQRAAETHRRVLIDFGGNWCPDCKVLDIYLHEPANSPILEAGFVVVHINVGLARIDRNLDIAERYQIPLKKGVPALAILDSDGKLIYSQRTGEFEDMRHMQSSAVTEFLTRWKPDRP